MEESEEYGALPLFDKLRLLAEWMPLVNRIQLIAAAQTPHEQALAVIDAAQWAAGRTGTEIDDEALAHIEAVLKTPEGQAFFEWALKKFEEAL